MRIAVIDSPTAASSESVRGGPINAHPDSVIAASATIPVAAMGRIGVRMEFPGEVVSAPTLPAGSDARPGAAPEARGGCPPK
ncbi:hypothetical protein GCM10025870_21760 [Agromyces marinus]|uniref:Uncharacterized protein n=1 Tax=Agromyces marinus TaxID=1389020 RepID=A0ABM8H2W1_9MICO|nr:hypothetical protein GCM10025870_21760 [Agromyces marinus]